MVITLAASVALDLDHLPLYLGAPMGAEGRPPTHSLLTVAVLATGGLLMRRHRSDLLAGSLGVALHLVRDVATGPGVPLWWPISSHPVIAPYAGYAVLLCLAAAATPAVKVRSLPASAPTP